jgi:hypothetical protein
MKALIRYCRHIEDFPPGHYLTRGLDKPRRYYDPAWREFSAVTGRPVDLAALRTGLEAAVHQQLMSGVPYGVLISGGTRFVRHFGRHGEVRRKPGRRRRPDAGLVAAAALVLHRAGGLSRPRRGPKGRGGDRHRAP